MSSAIGVDLDVIPIKALNVSCLAALSKRLNHEQQLCSSDGLLRDYRGLAELMDFERDDIQEFQRSRNPTLEILKEWQANGHTRTVGQLIKLLEQLGRFDIIQDSIPQFNKDAKSFLKRRLPEKPIQVPEVTSCRATGFNNNNKEDPYNLTVSDVQNGEYTTYDAYLCYAEEDSQFALELANYLESQFGFKFFIKDRDLLSGITEVDSCLELIHDRCRRILVFLSPEFIKRSSCEFEANFAAGVQLEQFTRKLIPIVIKPCEIPHIMKFVSKVDFTKSVNHQWVWSKLINSIRDSSGPFVSPSACLPSSNLAFNSHNELPPPSSNPMISFPPSAQQFFVCGTNSQSSISLPLPATSELASIQRSLPINVVKNTPPKQKWYQNLKGRLTSSISPSATHASSSSATTSGYQSQNSLCSTADLEYSPN